MGMTKFPTVAGTEGTSKNNIEKNVKGDTNKKRDALNALKYNGQVEEIPHGQYTRWRSL